ncbi:MAG: hypothetical protein JNM00_12435 [Flavobacteriales bacterium]|nr:hypothetical protein [Flavobacteriales bacterium]
MTDFPIFYILMLFAAGMAGAVFTFLKVAQSSTGIKLLLAYSAAYLLGLSLLHLFPEVFASDIAGAGWYVLGGFLLQIILDFFSQGVEHGHHHVHAHVGTRFLVLVMISLWIHAFIEGMPFGSGLTGETHVHGDHVHHHHGHDHRDSLLIGIGLHKLTEGFVFASLLLTTGLKGLRAWFWIVLFALMAPLGAVVQYFLVNTGVVDIHAITPIVTGVLIGILLHVSTTIIFEGSEGHAFNLRKFLAILLGIASSVLATSL